MKILFTPFVFILFFCFSLKAQPYTPGTTYFGENNYIEYIAGNLPIIISAPHGGTLEPAEIPDRDCSGCVYVRDSNTEELARQMQVAIFNLFGCNPHIIINRLHRRKLDANRAIGDAADGNVLAEQAWQDFHDFIDAAKDSATVNYGKGLYLDLHGHGHDIQRLELGYLLSKSELQQTDDVLDMPAFIDDSSIKNLVYDNLDELNLSDLLRGDDSFGELFENENYPAVPSKTDPFPFNADPYFSGGYNTDRHGSINGGSIDGIQIECNMDGVRDTHANREAFAEVTANVIQQYFEKHYFGVGFLTTDCGLFTDVEFSKNDFYNKINIFPNPVFDYLNIEFDSKINPHFSTTILNSLGETIYHNKNSNDGLLKIYVQHLPTGLYFIKLESGKFTETKKIIK